MSQSAAPQEESSTRLKVSNPKSNLTLTQLVKKIDSVIDNQPNYIARLYNEMSKINPDNAAIIHDYITAEQTEINIKDSTKGDKIKKLCWLSRHLNHKSFPEMTKQEQIS